MHMGMYMYTYVYVYVYVVTLIVHSSVVGLVGCFHFLAIVNKVAVNTEQQGPVEDNVEPFGQWRMTSFGHMPRSDRAGSQAIGF